MKEGKGSDELYQVYVDGVLNKDVSYDALPEAKAGFKQIKRSSKDVYVVDSNTDFVVYSTAKSRGHFYQITVNGMKEQIATKAGLKRFVVKFADLEPIFEISVIDRNQCVHYYGDLGFINFLRFFCEGGN